MVRIGEIGRGSIAEALELRIGTRILKVNGERVKDGLDFMFRTADEEIELEAVDPGGGRVVYEISRDPSEPLGIVPARDKIRECANECVFCFIDGNPPGHASPFGSATTTSASRSRTGATSRSPISGRAAFAASSTSAFRRSTSASTPPIPR